MTPGSDFLGVEKGGLMVEPTPGLESTDSDSIIKLVITKHVTPALLVLLAIIIALSKCGFAS